MILWLTLFAGGLLTFATRLSFILLFGQMQVPPRLQRALRFVPPAVLSAIIFPELLLTHGEVALSATNPRLVAGLLAALAAWRTKNVLVTIAVGMTVLLLLQALIAQ